MDHIIQTWSPRRPPLPLTITSIFQASKRLSRRVVVIIAVAAA